MLDLSAITAAIAAHLEPLFPSLNVAAEVSTVREPEVGSKPDLVICSGPFSEIAPPNYTYKARVECILFYQPEAASSFDPDSTLSAISSALASFLSSWQGSSLPDLAVHLYEGKLLPIVPKKSSLLYEYHIPLTLFLQF